MSGRARGNDVNKTQGERDSEALHLKVLHGLSLTIFSANGAEAAAALNDLLRWSSSGLRDFPQLAPNSPPPYPQASVCLVTALTRFISLHSRRWVSAPTSEPSLTALVILSNLVNVIDPEFSIKNAALIASIPECLLLLHRLSFDPHSPLSRIAQGVMLQLGRFCCIEHTLKDAEMNGFIESLSTLFLLSCADSDEPHIQIFLNFALLDANCQKFVGHIGAQLICRRFAQLLQTPSIGLRDFLIETLYAIAMTNQELKEAVCCSPPLLRALLNLAVPPSEPYPARPVVSFSPYRKACVFLLEICEDGRVAAYLSRFKQQIAVAMLKWKSCGLPLLALKISNVSNG
jgi:hypothetical protein